MLISQDRLERALRTLAETDLEYAQWKGAVLRSEYMAKVAESLAYKSLDGSIEDKKRAVLLLPEVQKAHEESFKAVVEYERLKARRQREVLVIELWRSMESSRRQGNVI